MKNHLYIYIPAIQEIKINVYPEKFFSKNRNIKFNCIITCKVTSFKEVSQIFCNFFKNRGISHICIFNPMNSSRFGWYGHLRIYSRT